MPGQGAKFPERAKPFAINVQAAIKGFLAFVSVCLFSGPIVFVSDSGESSPGLVPWLGPSTGTKTFQQ